MPLEEAERLKWVQANRGEPESWSGLGPLLRVVMKERVRRGPAWRRALLAVLEEEAGPALLSRVEDMDVRRGVLRLKVAEPAARYEMGLRWQQRLLAILQARLPAAGITAVRFVASG